MSLSWTWTSPPASPTSRDTPIAARCCPPSPPGVREPTKTMPSRPRPRSPPSAWTEHASRQRPRHHRDLLPARAVDRRGARRAVAGLAAGADPEPVRLRRPAGLAGRSDGRPPGGQGTQAQHRGDPGVQRDDLAAGRGADRADPVAGAADRHLGDIAAELPRLAGRHCLALGRAAYRPADPVVAGSGAPVPADPRPL